MKMLHAENTIATQGASETRATGVAGEAKVVYAILTGMVTDKIEYCLREPGTNAWEANRKRPFELTLPSTFLNIVRFRDFGPGISHQFMMQSYAKIGKSTKDGSDDDVGGWGFGSKSPLAYLMRQDGAGAFDVISRYKGMRRAYNIGINPKGQIQIAFLGEGPMDDTDRGTGLEVSFPVRPEDVNRFREYAERIFWGFSPAPIVLPQQGLTIGAGKRLLSTKTWSTWESRPDNKLPWSGPHVRLGPVLYPVRLDQLDGLSGFVLPKDNLLLEAPIGSLSVSASREQLSYDDRTKDQLVKLLKTYEDDFFLKAELQMAKCGSYFEAAAVAHNVCSTYGWERTDRLFKRLSWRGLPMRREVFSDTTSTAAYRAFKCSGFPDKFRATTYQPQDLKGRTIVVEHSAYRSLDRLAALGFDASSKLLWVRVGKSELPVFMRDFGLTEADITIMDKVKLPKRVVDPNAPDSVKTKIRTRKQFTWTGRQDTSPVDLLQGGFYVYHKKGSRYNYSYVEIDPHGPSGVFTNPREDRIQGFFEKLSKAGLLTEELTDQPILRLTNPDEELPDGWKPLGPALKAHAETMLDVTQITPRITWTKDSFDDRLNKLAKAELSDDCPAVFRDLVDRRAALLQRLTDETQTLNQHDRIADAIKSFVVNFTIPTTMDPSEAINTEFGAAGDKYLALLYILERCEQKYSCKNGVYDYHSLEANAQEALDDYFRLVAAL